MGSASRLSIVVPRSHYSGLHGSACSIDFNIAFQTRPQHKRRDALCLAQAFLIFASKYVLGQEEDHDTVIWAAPL